jgi:hypothetical protein
LRTNYCIYCRVSYDTCKSFLIENCKFIDSYFCTKTQVQSDIERTVNYLGQCFVKCENPNSYMFLPYIEKLELQKLINLLIYLLLNLSILIRINYRGHWILLIPRLKPSVVYVMDSLNREDETYIIQLALNTYVFFYYFWHFTMYRSW